MEIHVVAGPAFDNNRDGIRDTYREIALMRLVKCPRILLAFQKESNRKEGRKKKT